MDIIERTANLTLEDLGELAIDSLSDLMDDYWFDQLLEKSPMDRVMSQYLHGDCDYFKDAMHQVTGWNMVQIIHPKQGPYHRAVATPDGTIVDIRGYLSQDEACRHNKEKKPSMQLTILDGNIDDSIDNERLLEILQLMKFLDWAPFNEPWFIEQRENTLQRVISELSPNDIKQPASTLPGLP